MFFFAEGFTFRNFVADVFAVFLFVLWFWLLIIVISDLFRRHDISGWVKAIWVIALIVFPYLGIFAYLITQSRGMAERSGQQAQQARDELRRVVGFSVADESRNLIGSRNRERSPIRNTRGFAPSWWRSRRATIAAVPTSGIYSGNGRYPDDVKLARISSTSRHRSRRGSARENESSELVGEHLNERRDSGAYQEHEPEPFPAPG